MDEEVGNVTRFIGLINPVAVNMASVYDMINIYSNISLRGYVFISLVYTKFFTVSGYLADIPVYTIPYPHIKKIAALKNIYYLLCAIFIIYNY